MPKENNINEVEAIRNAAEAIIVADLQALGLLGDDFRFTIENVPAWYLYAAEPKEFVERAFQVILRRSPSLEDVNALSRQIETGSSTRSQILVAIARSDESQRLHGQDIQHLISLVMNEILLECCSEEQARLPVDGPIPASALLSIPDTSQFVVSAYYAVLSRMPTAADVKTMRAWIQSKDIDRASWLRWMTRQPEFDPNKCRVTDISTARDASSVGHATDSDAYAIRSLVSELKSLRESLSSGVRRPYHHHKTSSVNAPASLPFERSAPQVAHAKLEALQERILTELDVRFRGSEESLRRQLEFYLPYLSPIREQGPVLDIGCGRGTFLKLLEENDFSNVGLEINEAQFDECLSQKLNVRLVNAIDFLRDSPDASYGAVTLFHVIEHLSFGDLTEIINEAHRVLIPGGVIIMETPNSENFYVSLFMFNVDPTHVKPITYHYISTVLNVIGFDAEQLPVSTMLHDDVGGDTGNTHLDYILSRPANLSVIGRKH